MSLSALAADSAAKMPFVFLAGVASFLSPCVLPLLPGFLSYMSGVSVTAQSAVEAPRSRLVRSVGLFIIGFTLIFVGLGMASTLVGRFLFKNQTLFTRVAGVVVIIMGLVFIGAIRIPMLYSEKRFDMRTGSGPGGNLLMGMAFGFGWTPCIGATLGPALTLAASETVPGRGALLLLVYSLGLGIPFMFSALGISKVSGALRWFREHQRLTMRIGGALLISFGLLMVSNQVFVVSAAIQKAMRAIGLERLVAL